METVEVIIPFCFPLKNNVYRVIDGDTVECYLDRGWKTTKTVSVRLLGLDTPETRTRRDLEEQAGEAVTAVVQQWLKHRTDAGQQLFATSDQKPKFFGRTVGRIFAGGPDDCLNDYLLNAKLARTYEGGTRGDWEDEQLHEIIQRTEAILD